MISDYAGERLWRLVVQSTLLATGLLLLGLPAAFGQPPSVQLRVPASDEKHVVNVDKDGVALSGYDPVAYHTKSKPTKGDAAFTSKHAGATYYFSSEANKAAFDREPAKFVPLFGGFCGYGVSKGMLAPSDPNAFQLIDGRLLMQYDANAVAIFSKDIPGYMAKAREQWPKLVKAQQS